MHDGPGVRTTVFFKGCPLKCAWCHNPETQKAEKEILLYQTKCRVCGLCASCKSKAHLFSEEGHTLNRELCTLCGDCEKICPTNAIEIVGKDMTANEVLEIIKKDKAFYGENGGVTLSGGECLMQSGACEELLSECKKERIHTVIETALSVPWESIERTIPYCDLFFADFKIPESKKHKKYTGVENGLIISNLKRLVNKAPNKVTVRIPLIPNVNDTDGDIELFAKALSDISENLNGIEALRYNCFAESKYKDCGKRFVNFGASQTDGELSEFCERLEAAIENKTRVYCIV